MNYFNFKNALIKKSVVEDGYKYTVTVDGKDIAAGSIQGLVNVLNELYRMPKTDIFDEIFGDDFAYNKMNPISYSAKIKCAIDIDKNNSYEVIPYLCVMSLEDVEIGMVHTGTNETTTKPNLKYSFNQEDWTEWDYTPIAVETGKRVYFKGDNPTGISHFNMGNINKSTFTFSGKVNLLGNINSLLSETGEVESLTSFTFVDLFKGQSVVSAKKLQLPAINLANNCYANLFKECIYLIDSPIELPALTVPQSAYSGMFSGCVSLKNAPKMYATTFTGISACSAMFNHCESLVVAPALLATTLTNQCYYQMFQGCSSLKIVSDLPAEVVLTKSYGYMFNNCTSLVNAPKIYATTIGQQGIYYMFSGCTSLVTAPEILATSDSISTGGLSYMFARCTKLNYVNINLDSWKTDTDPMLTYEWLNGVAETGTFVKPAALEEIRGINNIPEGWTIVNK